MKSERGQSMVEFALVVPLLIILLFGIVDVSRLFHASLTMDHAGREAARAASLQLSDAEVIGTAVDSGSSISLASGHVDISPGAGARMSGERVTITITYPVDFLTPVIGNMAGSFELTNTTVMRVE
ncbi:TadE/TadG family type IV pilus assembly protein [Alkalicoccus halolimnae]|uniref:TadE family protein n=1 Tax=Alkalicoccus halolimnae TaxID=1667239 RepID=A0A5C7F600_9BACI|nr:TadE family protein [Alkalicoccus halolimnae]TXF86102.1 pilus assembly protein [Alkalicoccus halolimnae]